MISVSPHGVVWCHIDDCELPLTSKAFFIFNQKGEVLISRLFRTDLKSVLIPSSESQLIIRRSISDVFRIQVISNPDVRSPIITLGSTSFFHVRLNNVYIVGVTK